MRLEFLEVRILEEVYEAQRQLRSYLLLDSTSQPPLAGSRLTVVLERLGTTRTVSLWLTKSVSEDNCILSLFSWSVETALDSGVISTEG